jgi:glycosyltransferase involved in cell wall biosynthesis
MTAKIGIATAFFQHHKAGTWFYTLNLLRCFDAMPGAAERFQTLDFLDRPVPGLNNIRHVTCRFPDHKLAKVFWPNLVLPGSAARQGLDVVHATTHYGTFVPCRHKNVITVTDVSPILHPETHERGQVMYHRHVLPLVLQRADAIVTISESSKKDILSCYKVPEGKVQVIPLGVDGHFVPDSGVENSFTATLPERYILNIGTLEARKNLPRLLEAYALARRKGLTHKLLIGGARGWRLSDLAGIVEKYQLEEDVVFLGFVEDADLPLLYGRADFFVYPSIYEGFGMPILEAMACGTPVITSNCSSMPEVAGDAALLVAPLDVEELAGRMLELAGDSELRASLRQRGLARAADFTWQKTALETYAVYERIM